MDMNTRVPVIVMTLVFAAGMLLVSAPAEAKSKKKKIEQKTVKVEKTEVVTQTGSLVVPPRQIPPTGFNPPGPKGPEVQNQIFNPQGSQAFPAGYVPPGYVVSQEAKPTVTENTEESIAYLEKRRAELEKRKVDPAQIEAIDREIKTLKSSLKDLKDQKKAVKKEEKSEKKAGVEKPAEA
jgi:hypothetical protein